MTRAEEIRDRIVTETARTGFGALGLHVLIGYDEAEHRWADDVRVDVQSVAKGVCVLATAIAVEEGLISIDAPVSQYLPELDYGAGAELVTLRHLLTMSSGIDLPWSETMMTDWPDLAAEFLSRPTSGRAFQYSNASTYTAMTVLASQVGDIAEYLEPRLFAPLGLEGLEWERCPLGRVIAGGGIPMRTTEMARLGRLIRDRGRADGARIVGADWIDAMHADWVDAGEGAGYERYALAGWDGPGAGWRLHGAYGQLLIFVDDAVVTITAEDHFGADAMAAFAVDALRS